MGDGSEQALEYASRNMYEPRCNARAGRNPKVARCPICKKGIRAIAGEVRESLEMHMKATGCDLLADQQNNQSPFGGTRPGL